MGGRKSDNKFVFFNIAIVVGKLKQDGCNFVLGISINDIALVDKIVKNRLEKEIHDDEIEVRVRIHKFLEFGIGSHINFGGSNCFKIEVISMV